MPKDKSTSKNLIDILEELFLPEDIFNIILEKIEPLIRDADHYIGENLFLNSYYSHLDSELARLHEPISQIPKINNKLKLFVENYIHQMGIDAIQRLNEIPVDVNFIFFISNLHSYFYDIRTSKFISKQCLIFTRHFSNLYRRFSIMKKILLLFLIK